MLLPLLLLAAMLFLTAIFFYKQTNTDFHILQMESAQLDQLADLAEERQPIVIRGIQVPMPATTGALKAIPRLGGTLIAGVPLGDLLEGRSHLLSDGPPAMTSGAARQFASEIGLDVWASQVWKEHLLATSWLGNLVGSIRTVVGFGGIGLFQTSAMLTLLIPCEGSYYASIIPKSREVYLPKQWQWRYPATFTMNDTPLVAELAFMDIKLRPGTGLLLPPHTYISLSPESKALTTYVVIEYHEPISMLASKN